MSIHDRTYDIIGVGFGPSNLALALALDEISLHERPGLSYHFLERQPHFIWHGGMLLPDSDMQISFLKDLVSLRDPTSPYTFVNYLSEQGRLEAFINRKTFFPSRIEFNDYLRWVAARFEDRCSYGEEVFSIEPHIKGHVVSAFDIRSRTRAGGETLRRARHVVVAVGGQPYVPPCFSALTGDARLLHSSRYLDGIDAAGVSDVPGSRIAVVGGGQSAAEIFVDLCGRFRHARIDLVVRGWALKPSDDSPFVNEVFNPESTDAFFRQPEADRRGFLEAFRNTNYAVVDQDLIQRIYTAFYEQQVARGTRLSLRNRREVIAAAGDSRHIALTLADGDGETTELHRYDAVVLATGYRRGLDSPLFAHLDPYIESRAVQRDYSLRTTDDCDAGIFVQGQSEETHGLSDTLLSVVAVRAQEIAVTIVDRLPHLAMERPAAPVRLAVSS
ncbi:lysine N(6)-hydroxylase/L-ornithine N(5)-oxygenase family protein [Pseudochelatococcus sp. B33]